jgi:hypothetical protein
LVVALGAVFLPGGGAFRGAARGDDFFFAVSFVVVFFLRRDGMKDVIHRDCAAS